jgi:DNA-binding YbaB/EbfC family protein
MKDLFNMMGKMREMETALREAQEALGTIVVSAEAGGGMVKATVNGKKQVLKIEVDNDLINPNDKEMMQDLIVAALNKALNDAEEQGKKFLQSKTKDFLPNVPGMDLGNFMA